MCTIIKVLLSSCDKNDFRNEMCGVGHGPKMAYAWFRIRRKVTFCRELVDSFVVIPFLMLY